MISDLSSQWPVLVVAGPLLAILAGITSWFIRHTINQLNRRIDRQDERIKDMANQIVENEDKRVETERKLARLQERHAALKERVDTGFDILQRRLDSNIERFRADTSSTITEVRLILKDPSEDDGDLPDGRSL